MIDIDNIDCLMRRRCRHVVQMAGSPDDASSDILTVTCAVCNIHVHGSLNLMRYLSTRERRRRSKKGAPWRVEEKGGSGGGWTGRPLGSQKKPARAVELLFGGDRSRRKRAVVYTRLRVRDEPSTDVRWSLASFLRRKCGPRVGQRTT
jgi:hypothetical protein